MYAKENKLFKAKVGKLYVESVSMITGKEIRLSERDTYVRYLNTQEKDFVLKHFPDALVKELIVTENDGNW